MSDTPQPVTLPAAPGLGDAARSRALSLLSIVGGVALWQLASLVIRDPVLLPGPLATIEVFIRYLGKPYPSNGETLIGHMLVSLGRVIAGFAIGSAIGIPFGALMARFERFRAVVDPFIELTRPLPPLAFVPVLIVWFGIGEAPKIILIAAGVVPVMAISTAAGLASVPEDMLNAARCLGASDAYAMLHVRIRAAASPIITGMRLSIGISWTSIVAVEMIAATSGLGFVILQAGQFLDTQLIFAGILLIAGIGLALDAGLRALQRRLDPTLAK
jgi:NitT/TauT family transport system permease protein/taurine transport system permease protein